MQQYIRSLSIFQRIQLFIASIKTGRPQKDIMKDIIEMSLEERKRAPQKGSEE